MNDDVRNALAPLEFILGVAATLMLLGLVAVVPATIFGSGSFLGFGDSEVCVTASQSAVGMGNVQSRLLEPHVGGLRPGVRATGNTFELCDSSPSLIQRTWWQLGHTPEFLYVLIFLLLAWRLTRTARRQGLFSPHLALALGRLGLFVLLGAVAVSLLRALGDARLITSLVTQPNTTFDLLTDFFSLSWTALFAGFGLLTVGRVMARSVLMQREIDATV